MTKADYLKSLDSDNIPFRPVNLDGTKIRFKDMTKAQRSVYRKWLKFNKISD